MIDEELDRQKLKLADIGFEVHGVKILHRTESYSFNDGKLTSRASRAGTDGECLVFATVSGHKYLVEPS